MIPNHTVAALEENTSQICLLNNIATLHWRMNPDQKLKVVQMQYKASAVYAHKRAGADMMWIWYLSCSRQQRGRLWPKRCGTDGGGLRHRKKKRMKGGRLNRMQASLALLNTTPLLDYQLFCAINDRHDKDNGWHERHNDSKWMGMENA